MNFQSPKPKAQSPKSKVGRVSDFGHWILDSRLRPSNFGDRDGIALVITLIMLAIITFMAVTFLVLSQRERSSVNTAMDQKMARNASDAGLARVSAELLGRIMFHTNFQDFNLLSSTNYINLNGFFPGVPGTLSPTNVNYDYLVGPAHAPIVNSQDRNINIASLLFNPRPPVYVVTNTGTGQAEFRYYVDLNRNGRDDPNGNWPVVVTDNLGNPAYVGTNVTGQFVTVSTNLPINRWLLTNSFVGDPEWIGVLERPEELHSADNRFIARYAYLVVPVGKTLDVNYIHNRAKRPAIPTNEGFLRNQGVGTWEINLAAFLADLNTNAWWNPVPGYNYSQVNAAASFGPAFANANDILNYRYGPPGSFLNLYPASAVLAGTPFSLATALASYNIDVYSDGPLMLGTATNESTPSDVPSVAWSGSENTNHYFSTQDIFSQMPPGFKTMLSNLGTSNDSYNAYTFYRMVAQLGTDSATEQNKLNINFKNTDIHGNIVPGMETNLIPWTAEDFFTNAANRIMSGFTNDMGVPLTTAYIPLYPTNYYTPAVHRALQMAANIFDATTNQTVPLLSSQTNALFPSVFRPVFTSQNGQVWICGYKEVVDLTPLNNFQWWDFNTASNNPGVYPFLNVYGVPWVVGAKKGWPNFNQFAMETDYLLTRKLAFIKKQSSSGSSINPNDYTIRQMFTMTASNSVGFQAWNSYNSDWPMTTRPLRLYTTNIFSLRIMNNTNPVGIDLIPATVQTTYGAGNLNFMPNSWGRYNGAGSTASKAASQIFLGQSNYTALDGNTYAYHATIPGFRPGTNYDQTVAPIPPFFVVTTNRVIYAMIDANANRIVDFVNLDDSGKVLDFTGALSQYAVCNAPRSTPMQPSVMWCTNKITGTPITPDAMSQGLDLQIEANLGIPGGPQIVGWNQFPTDPGNAGQIQGFRNLLKSSPVGSTNQTPYNPSFGITNLISWEANDPMVHYTIPDLTDQNSLNKPGIYGIGGNLNHRYSPWDSLNPAPADSKSMPQSAAKKDPLAVNSDAWDFPTNKFWNIGILGRVHRGTPWQTVYMKSPMIRLTDWQKWCGSTVIDTNADNGNDIFADAALSSPTNDYRLFDLFTTAVNAGAARGQLNINQTNLAAWSAVLSGVNVITNDIVGATGPAVISPAGVYDTNSLTPVAKIWMGINKARANTDTNSQIFRNQTFQHLGDVLSAPELTVASPFINANAPANDEVYERIPQQIMSLLTLNQTPRFVIYSYGQTLHPADHSLVIGGTFNGLCTNYQITAESAVRAVVRMEGTPDPRFVNGRVDSQGRSYPPRLVIEQFNVLGPD